MKPTAFRGSNLTHQTRQRVCRWLVANGLSPARMRLDDVIVVTGNRIHYHEAIFDRRRDGSEQIRLRRDRDGDWATVSRPRVTRLRYALEDIA